MRTVSLALPQTRAALLLTNSHRLMGWPGDISAPGIHLLNLASTADALIMPVGKAARNVQLFETTNQKLQMLWLDQTDLGETRLMGALLDSNLQVEHGPTPISNLATSYYQAVGMPQGDVYTFWVNLSNPASQASPLFFQQISAAGIARQAVRLSASGRYPSAVLDAQQILHVAWLQPDGARQWSIRYGAYAGETPAAGADRAVGAIHLNSGEALDSFAIGLDSTRIYCVWTLIRVNADGTVSGHLGGITFGLDDSRNSIPINFDVPALKVQSLRWLATARSMPAATKNLLITVTATANTVSAQTSQPLLVVLSGQAVTDVQTVAQETRPNAVLGQTTLTLGPDNNLYVAWPTLYDNGSAALYLATRPPLATTPVPGS